MGGAGAAPLVPICTRGRWHADMQEHLEREHRQQSRPRFGTTGDAAWEDQFGFHAPRGSNRPGEQGDAIIARIWDLIQIMEQLDKKFRFPSQIEMHKVFMAALLRQIYKDDWQLVADRVLPQYGITHLSQEVLVRTGRQVGKSTAMRMFCAPLMLSMPDVTIAVCAPRFGQSQNIVNPVKHAVKVLIAILQRDRGEKWKILDDNSRKFNVQCQNDPNAFHDVRSITPYPGDEKVGDDNAATAQVIGDNVTTITQRRARVVKTSGIPCPPGWGDHDLWKPVPVAVSTWWAVYFVMRDSPKVLEERMLRWRQATARALKARSKVLPSPPCAHGELWVAYLGDIVRGSVEGEHAVGDKPEEWMGPGGKPGEAGWSTKRLHVTWFPLKRGGSDTPMQFHEPRVFIDPHTGELHVVWLDDTGGEEANAGKNMHAPRVTPHKHNDAATVHVMGSGHNDEWVSGQQGRSLCIETWRLVAGRGGGGKDGDAKVRLKRKPRRGGKKGGKGKGKGDKKKPHTTEPRAVYATYARPYLITGPARTFSVPSLALNPRGLTSTFLGDSHGRVWRWEYFGPGTAGAMNAAGYSTADSNKTNPPPAMATPVFNLYLVSGFDQIDEHSQPVPDGTRPTPIVSHIEESRTRLTGEEGYTLMTIAYEHAGHTIWWHASRLRPSPIDVNMGRGKPRLLNSSRRLSRKTRFRLAGATPKNAYTRGNTFIQATVHPTDGNMVSYIDRREQHLHVIVEEEMAETVTPAGVFAPGTPEEVPCESAPAEAPPVGTVAETPPEDASATTPAAKTPDEQTPAKAPTYVSSEMKIPMSIVHCTQHQGLGALLWFVTAAGGVVAVPLRDYTKFLEKTGVPDVAAVSPGKEEDKALGKEEAPTEEDAADAMPPLEDAATPTPAKPHNWVGNYVLTPPPIPCAPRCAKVYTDPLFTQSLWLLGDNWVGVCTFMEEGEKQVVPV